MTTFRAGTPATSAGDLPRRANDLSAWPWPIAGFWVLLAVVVCTEFFIASQIGGPRAPLLDVILRFGGPPLTYALLSPAISALSRARPLHAPHLWRNLSLHIAASLACTTLYVGEYTLVVLWRNPQVISPTFPMWLLARFVTWAIYTTGAYWITVGATHGVMYLAEARRREAEAAVLTAQLAEARLSALQMQLHPHFLFNTLNAIAVLARDGDTAAVTRMVMLLAGLMRDVLDGETGQVVALEREVSFIRRYLEIQQVRFGERLSVVMEVDAAAAEARVPLFILQPLVENALRHGLARRVGNGELRVGARMRGDALEAWIRDDGEGLPAEWGGEADYGVGLTNTASRLREMYGRRARLELRPHDGGGTTAWMTIPQAAGPIAARAGR